MKLKLALNKPKVTQVQGGLVDNSKDMSKKGEGKKKRNSKLPPDTYQEEFDPKRLIIDDNGLLNFSVRRGGELGLHRLDVRHYQTTSFYTGFTQKGINIPVEMLDDLIDTLTEIRELCTEKEIL